MIENLGLKPTAIVVTSHRDRVAGIRRADRLSRVPRNVDKRQAPSMPRGVVSHPPQPRNRQAENLRQHRSERQDLRQIRTGGRTEMFAGEVVEDALGLV